MSRWFTVPIVVHIQVKVPETADVDKDREEAAHIATTLFNKRIRECTWGVGNPWTATVRAAEVGYPNEGFYTEDTPTEEEEDDGDETDD